MSVPTSLLTLKHSKDAVLFRTARTNIGKGLSLGTFFNEMSSRNVCSNLTPLCANGVLHGDSRLRRSMIPVTGGPKIGLTLWPQLHACSFYFTPKRLRSA